MREFFEMQMAAFNDHLSFLKKYRWLRTSLVPGCARFAASQGIDRAFKKSQFICPICLIRGPILSYGLPVSLAFGQFHHQHLVDLRTVHI
jgi:hypothetical protein